MSNPKLSFLVVNFNGGPLLREALESIERQTFTDYEVIVVDNGSADNSWGVPMFSRENWSLIRLDRNSGFSEGNNIAFQRSRGAVIALINNDVVLDPEWAGHVVAAFDDPEIGSVATRLLQKSDPSRLDSAGFDVYSCGTTMGWGGLPANALDGKLHQPFGAVAAAAAYRRSALEKTGLFHPEYFAYYEDTDLGMRLSLFGYGCRYLDAACGTHRGSATGRLFSDFHRFHLRRNIEYLFWVNMIGRLAWKYLPGHALYELLAWLGMVARRQGLVFWKAKLAAVRKLAWIVRERRALRSALEKSLGATKAQRNLEARFLPYRGVFCRQENELKFR